LACPWQSGWTTPLPHPAILVCTHIGLPYCPIALGNSLTRNSNELI
jgi:hypothetical protein